MDRDTIYIDKTGIGNVNNSEFQYTTGPNPGQFIINSEHTDSVEPPQAGKGFEAANCIDTKFTLDDVVADSSQPAPEMPGFDKIDLAGFVNGGGGETPNWNGGSSFGSSNGGTGNSGGPATGSVSGFGGGNGGTANTGEAPTGNGSGGNANGGNGGNGSEPPRGNDRHPPAGDGKRRRKKVESKPVNLTRSSLVAIIIICVFLSSAFGFGGAMLASNMVKPAGNAGINNTTNADTKGFDLEDATGSEMTVQEITQATLDSVVEIRTESVQMDSWMGQYVTEGAGSGVIIKENGYIITNNHVVTGASNIIVTTTDKKEYEATLIGADADTDVAVIKINAKGLKAASMGNSDQLNVGDLAVAIGNPLGELGGTVTAGIISALDRSISIDGKTMTLLQTDTSINPGNSGGGLFNQYGQLIGVVVAKSSGSDVEGLGFAIPINRASEVASQLMDGGYVKGKPSTGMAYQDMSQQQQQSSDMFGFGFDEFFGGGSMQQSGVYIAEINGRNAKKAGFEIGDMVYSVDGQEIDSFDTLSSIITSHKVGDTVTYIVLRDGQALEIDLVLEEKTE